jgi:MFS family permease
MPSGWQRVPTVYGPVMTAIQWLAAHFGGNSMARIIFLLKWANAAAFIGTGVILDRMTGPDPVRRLRACLLWTANPLILFWMVGSGHADVFAVFFLVAALYAARRSAFAGGLLGGAAVAVKASFLFPAAGLVVAAWLSPARYRRAAASVVGILLVGGGGYLLAGPAALNSLNARLGRKKDRYLPVPEFILTHHGMYMVWMAVLAVALTAFLWWRSGLPFALWRRPSAEVRRLPLDVLPVAVLAFGTTLVSPLQYPWYDAMLLPMLALLPYRRLDWTVVVRGTMLGVFTLPGVRVNGYQHLGVRWANLLWLAVFVLVVWRTSRRTPAAEPPVEPSTLLPPAPPSASPSSPAPAA